MNAIIRRRGPMISDNEPLIERPMCIRIDMDVKTAFTWNPGYISQQIYSDYKLDDAASVNINIYTALQIPLSVGKHTVYFWVRSSNSNTAGRLDIGCHDYPDYLDVLYARLPYNLSEKLINVSTSNSNIISVPNSVPLVDILDDNVIYSLLKNHAYSSNHYSADNIGAIRVPKGVKTKWIAVSSANNAFVKKMTEHKFKYNI